VTATPATQVADGALLRGIAMMVELDPAGFDGEGDMVLFATMLDGFFAQYVSLNAFSRLTVRSVGSGEERRWPARLGDRRLL
jgi:type VI secretion system protein ImpG